ncbi:MAG TPA: hypothetical protein PKC43_09540 [Phycisphaerales bacterium]|nr:hypothetical protein [Phycisphaerales bacterium]HMP37676.1 hypothetical protein [Phycisphaerales bacterium]
MNALRGERRADARRPSAPARGRASPSPLVVAAALCAAVLTAASCRTGQRGDSGDADAGAAPAPFSERWNEVVESQRARLDAMEQLYASGQVELRWRDRRGNHFEYCRGELFLRLPDETALSLTKVGERFLWVGSAAGSRWMFDLRDREPTLWIVETAAAEPRRFPLDGPGGTGEPAQRADAGPLDLSRLSLIDVLGLLRFPEAADLDSVLEDGSGSGGGIVVEFAGDGGPLRVTVDAITRLPTVIEVLDDEGRTQLRSELSRYEPADRPGKPPGGRPRFPNTVVIDASGDSGERREVRLFLEPDPRGEARIAERLFDLETLTATFRPTQVARP